MSDAKSAKVGHYVLVHVRLFGWKLLVVARKITIKPLKHQADLVIPNNHNFEQALDILTLALKAKLGR